MNTLAKSTGINMLKLHSAVVGMLHQWEHVSVYIEAAHILECHVFLFLLLTYLAPLPLQIPSPS